MKKTKIYAKVLDEKTLEQFSRAMEIDCNIEGALMPDAHSGYTLPIGAVIKSKERVFPSYVGYDIGCGVCAIKLDIEKEDIDLKEIKEFIIKNIPIGMASHQVAREYIPLYSTLFTKEIYERVGKFQLGTLGGGNHFIELGVGSDKKVWIVVHSGSRGFGKQVAEYYMQLAKIKSIDTKEFEDEFESKNLNFKVHNPIKFEEAKKKFVQKKLKNLSKGDIEGHFSFSIDSKEGINYILDMNCALEFALENRKRMIYTIVELLGSPKELMFINRNHNHAEIKDRFIIHRKGATHAENGMFGVIPGNMRDGSFIVKGKGCKDSICSSSHGAGRVLSRNEAKRELDLSEFHNSMIGIETNHSDLTIDEAPMAYKNIFEVMEMQKELVEIVEHIKVILNIKG